MSVRIYHDNFLVPELISSQTFSSEQSAFPITNIFNFQRRSKVWRSNGYWDITSSNNEIIFRETALTDLTATVAIAEYASSTALYAAIKTALEAAGASVYTIISNATNLKVDITSDGAGGGGIFEVDWINSSMAPTLGFNILEEDTGLLTYTADILRIHTSEWIKWDFGITTLPKAFAMTGARNEPIKITPSATITIEGNETDVWTAPSGSVTPTYNDDVIFSASATGLWTEALRYARLNIVDNDNADGYIEIGSMFLGDFFDPTRGKAQYPFSGAYVDASITSFSEGGQSFSDTRQKTENFGIKWFGLTIAEKEEIDDLWITLGTSNPFFVQFDSDVAFSSTANKLVRYVKFESPPSYELVSPGNYACTMQMREEL